MLTQPGTATILAFIDSVRPTPETRHPTTTLPETITLTLTLPLHENFC
jgi:hypothetical protein